MPNSAGGASGGAELADAGAGLGGVGTEAQTGAPGMTGGAATDAVRGVELTGEPFYTRAQRLTNSQWDHAVTDILRLHTPRVGARLSHPATRHHGFLEQRARARLLA